MGEPLPLWAVIASAASGVAEPRAWVVTTEAGAFQVTGATPPLTVLPPQDRTCRVGLVWSPQGPQATDHGCPEAVRQVALRTVSEWQVAPPEGLVGEHELVEVWFVYPFETGTEVRVMVRQAHDRALVLPAGIDPVPFAIRAWTFLRYPEEVHAPHLPDVTCDIDVAADPRGVAVEVTVDGCPDPYRRAAHDAISTWRFAAPRIHGEPIPSALAITATFAAAPPATPERTPPPGEDRQQLWRDRQFDQLTREERVWFIQATLLGQDGEDLGPGHVRFRFPAPADLGGRPPNDFFSTDRFATYDPPPPLPDHPPILVLGEPDRIGIEVYAMPLPTPGQVPGAVRGTTCPLQVQVDGHRQVWAWTEGCSDEARVLATSVADGWILRHEGSGRGEERKRFRAELVFDAEGHTRVRLDADRVRTPVDQLPDWVSTWREARATFRVPPRLPRGRALPEGDCLLDVTLDASGHIDSVVPVTCPTDFQKDGIRTVRRWRFAPAEDDGVRVPSHTRVTIRFR